MTKRQARKRALSAAAGILEATVDGGWPFDEMDAGNITEEDCGKMQAALADIANGLGRRFARMELADVRRARAATGGD